MNKTTGLGLASVLLCALVQTPLVQAYEERSAPLTLAHLSDWVHTRCRADQTLRIALVGCHPDLQDEPLRSDHHSPFRLIVPSLPKDYKPSQADTELLAWLRSVWPRMTVWALPCDNSSQGWLAEELDRTLRHWREEEASGPGKPDVLLVQQSVLTSALHESPKIRDTLIGCWQIGCLSIAIRDNKRAGPCIPGMLAISLIPESEFVSSTVAEPQEYISRPVSLRLPEQCLTGAPDIWDGKARAATAYLALVSAALPVREMPVILERASLLGLTSPVLTNSVTSRQFYRVVNPVAATSGIGKKFYLVDRYFDWEAKVGDEKSVSTIADAFHSPYEETRRILAGIRGETRLRHLAVLEELTRLHVISLVRSSPNGIVVFRSDAEPKAGFLDSTLSILATQTSKENPHLPFTSLAGDTKIGIKAVSRE